MNFPSYSDIKVIFGGTIISYTIIPHLGYSDVDYTNPISILFSGNGFKAVFVGETLLDMLHLSGLLVLSQIWAVKYSVKK
jgi:hypothetical protein